MDKVKAVVTLGKEKHLAAKEIEKYQNSETTEGEALLQYNIDKYDALDVAINSMKNENSHKDGYWMIVKTWENSLAKPKVEFMCCKCHCKVGVSTTEYCPDCGSHNGHEIKDCTAMDEKEIYGIEETN